MRGIVGLVKKLFKICFIFILVVGVIGAFVHKPILKSQFPIGYEREVYYYSGQYNLDPMMVYAVIRIESNFQIRARSNKNAAGLMQIMPETGKWIAEQMGITNFKEEDLNHSETNIKFGSWYLSNLKEEFNNNMDLVLAAYNAGRGNVNNWLGDTKYSDDGLLLKRIPFEETKNYVLKVNLAYKMYKYLYT